MFKLVRNKNVKMRGFTMNNYSKNCINIHFEWSSICEGIIPKNKE